MKTLLAYITLITLILFFSACNPSNVTGPVDPGVTYVETKYVYEGLDVFSSCWYPWASDSTRDSLIVEGRKYTISTRSRYRTIEEPDTFGDTYAEGPVKLINERFYIDTKTDTIFVFNQCGIEGVK